VGASLEANHLADGEGAGTQYRPDFLLIEDLFLLDALLDLLLEGVVQVFIEEGYLVEGGAKGVFQLGVGSLQVEDVLVLLGQLLREVYEGLLVGLLVGEGVLLHEMQTPV
jgi:hypothetical protein